MNQTKAKHLNLPLEGWVEDQHILGVTPEEVTIISTVKYPDSDHIELVVSHHSDGKEESYPAECVHLTKQEALLEMRAALLEEISEHLRDVNSLERALKKVDSQLSLRTQIREILCNWLKPTSE